MRPRPRWCPGQPPRCRPRWSILLAEDNPINVFLVQSLLKGTGHRITTASNGLVALEMFRGGNYDVLVTDVQMPGMDGYTLVREVRRHEAAEGRRRAAVIALTAHAFETDAQRSLEAGCDAHLTKPINRARLLAALDKYRPAPQAGKPPAPAPLGRGTHRAADRPPEHPAHHRRPGRAGTHRRRHRVVPEGD